MCVGVGMASGLGVGASDYGENLESNDGGLMSYRRSGQEAFLKASCRRFSKT